LEAAKQPETKMAYQPRISIDCDLKLVALIVGGLLLVMAHASMAHAQDVLSTPLPPMPSASDTPAVRAAKDNYNGALNGALGGTQSRGVVVDPYAGLFHKPSAAELARQKADDDAWAARCVDHMRVDPVTNVTYYEFKPNVGGAMCK
jgi:hypothetical protein